MKTPLLALLLCVLAFSARAQDAGALSTARTAGDLIFSQRAIVFRTAANEERYPFPEPRTGSDFGAASTPVIPGLRLRRFEPRFARAHGASKDVSRLVLVSSDGTLIELVAGEPVAVVRTEVELADHRREVRWRPAVPSA